MRRLRIAFLSGGGFVHIGPYLDYFRDRGHEVILVAYDRLAKDYGVQTFDVSRGASGKNGLSKWKYLLAGISLRRLIRRIKPDILNGHYVTSAGTICRLAGFRPFVLTAHGSDLVVAARSPLWRRVVSSALKRAALVNTVSEPLRDIARSMGVADANILVSTLGVDTSVFRYEPAVELRSPPRLLCTRTLGEVYDPLTILRGCEVLRDRGVACTLTFAAGGPLIDGLRKKTAEAGLADRVRFLGGFDNRSLPDMLREHDIYVSASLWDGTSISLLEAMASGLVPVVSRIESNQAWLADGVSAMMFDRGDAARMAEAVERAIADGAWRRSAVQANRDTVVRRADRHTNMAALEAAFFRIVEGGRGGRVTSDPEADRVEELAT